MRLFSSLHLDTVPTSEDQRTAGETQRGNDRYETNVLRQITVMMGMYLGSN